MSHTEGPWFIWLRNPENGMLHVGPSGHSIAWVINIDDERGNANLLSAAPDLLAAAKLAFDYVEDLSLESPWDALQKAIAKAEGN